MEYRNLGASGLKISEIILGNWITHGSQIEAEVAKQTVNVALDLGITTFDTADVYADTKAETVLGEALKGQRREGLEIFTKVFWPTGPGINDRGLSRKHIIESCNNSLKRLQTDYVDLYQAHRYDYETPLEETLRAFDDLVRAGKVHYIGVSEWTSEQIAAAVAIADDMGLDRIVSNQPQYSMLWRVIEEKVIPTSFEFGIGQIVWSPIAQGVLTGKYLPGEPAPAGSRATDPNGSRFMGRFFEVDGLLAAVQNLKPIAADLNLTMAQLAVAWVLNQPGISAAIVGASKPEQLQDSAAASGIELSADVLAAIDAALGEYIVRDPAKTEESSPKQRP